MRARRWRTRSPRTSCAGESLRAWQRSWRHSDASARALPLALPDRYDELPVAVGARAPFADVDGAAALVLDLDERRHVAAWRSVEHHAQFLVLGAHRLRAPSTSGALAARRQYSQSFSCNRCSRNQPTAQ